MARIKPRQLLIQSKTKKTPSRISYSTIITWNLIVVLVVLSLYATQRHWHHRSMSFPITLLFVHFFYLVSQAYLI
ncbi:hypothetical protein BAE44_0001906 [Dichanthelium oligosanthes]|uniref:Uncharacterized protein n=1 Tax=Dichanthelium oligosanthes TaxID=888268 RepID=A0A1E5WI44_9POAL|nr:hypothetical protein BAE44_0001906 [Dichanthelium oligosanthes]